MYYSWYISLYKLNTSSHIKISERVLSSLYGEQKDRGKKIFVARLQIFALDLLLIFQGFDIIMISGRCAACKNQRRKCPSECIFSPYFPPNDPQRYACVHRIFGGSNVGKMLQQIPPYARAQAADSLYFEAQCRIQDPIYGCFGIISQLVQQIHYTECELAKVQAHINILRSQIPTSWR